MAKEKVLVTGGAGFIGSNLVERLLREGYAVRILDDFSTGRRENIAPFLQKVEVVEGSVCDADIVTRAVQNASVVFHLAALPSVPRSIQFPEQTNRVNVEGTVRLLDAAAKAGVRRLVFASSSSVYGDTPTLPKREEMSANPLSPYAASKLSGEYYCQVFSLTTKLEAVALRFFNVYGPRQDPHSQYAAVIPIFIAKLLKSEVPPIYGDGEQTRDFTFVEDAVEGIVRSATAQNVSGEVINIAGGRQITVSTMFQTVAKTLGSSVKPQYLPPRSGDIVHSFADIAKARKLLGYAPRCSLEEGLKKTVGWFRE